MTELVKQEWKDRYKFMVTVERKVTDALIMEGEKEGLSLQDKVWNVLGEWYRRQNHGS